jgi:LuxR family maltose regulon positive regulatory protein
MREYEHVTLAQVLLAKHAADGSGQSLDDADGLLRRLVVMTENAGRTGTLINSLALLALTRQAAGDDSAALDPLERALILAEPEQFVRVFASHGDAMTGLLTALDRRRPGWLFLHLVLDAAKASPRDQNAGLTRAADRSAEGRLIDPLTGRERDVLRLLTSDLDGPAIARELVLSLNTVRTHTKNLYAKLGVTSRRAAVTRAHQLDLLSRSFPR